MNVVLLITDQQSHAFLGCDGYPGLETPGYDRLAGDGLRFTQATCAVSPCLPSRHSFLHGLYAFQSGIYTNLHLMPEEQVPPWTLGRSFREAGYATGAYGKMHLVPYSAPVTRTYDFGFQERAAHFHEAGERMDTHFAAERREWTETRISEREAHGVGPGGDDCGAAFLGYASSLPLDQTPDWWIAGQAADFIRRNQENPFFLVCSLTGPHAPHAVPADFANRYDPRDVELPPDPPSGLPDEGAWSEYEGLDREDLRTAIANYMGCVSACDTAHQRVLDALDATGLYDDTLVVYFSDHGELLGARGPASFSKYNLYDPSIRVPVVLKPPMSWGYGGGAVDDRLVSLIDLAPTFMEAAALAPVSHLPGISLVPLLSNAACERKRDVSLTELHRPGGLHQTYRSDEWKIIDGPFGMELYHIAEDPWEFRNLADDAVSDRVMSELRGRAIEEMRLASDRYASRHTGFERQPWGVFVN